MFLMAMIDLLVLSLLVRLLLANYAKLLIFLYMTNLEKQMSEMLSDMDSTFSYVRKCFSQSTVLFHPSVIFRLEPFPDGRKLYRMLVCYTILPRSSSVSSNPYILVHYQRGNNLYNVRNCRTFIKNIDRYRKGIKVCITKECTF